MKVLIDGHNNRFYCFPKGEDENPDLNKYLNEKNPAAIEVNEEDYQIYSEMGSSFQLCKVIHSLIVIATTLSNPDFRFVWRMKKTLKLNLVCI